MNTFAKWMIVWGVIIGLILGFVGGYFWPTIKNKVSSSASTTTSSPSSNDIDSASLNAISAYSSAVIDVVDQQFNQYITALGNGNYATGLQFYATNANAVFLNSQNQQAILSKTKPSAPIIPSCCVENTHSTSITTTTFYKSSTDNNEYITQQTIIKQYVNYWVKGNPCSKRTNMTQTVGPIKYMQNWVGSSFFDTSKLYLDPAEKPNPKIETMEYDIPNPSFNKDNCCGPSTAKPNPTSGSTN